MNCLVYLFCIAFSMANAHPWFNYRCSYHRHKINNIPIKGPSTTSSIAGPGSSYITSLANAGAAGYQDPFIPSNPEYSSSHSSHTYSLPYSSHLYGTRKAIISGPSGTIIASDPSYNSYVPTHLYRW